MHNEESFNNRLKKLEDRVDVLEQYATRHILEKDEQPSYQEESDMTEKEVAKEIKLRKISREKTEKIDSKIAAFFRWLREDWLMKLGAFLLILAAGWFVTYAFANNWIGEVGRISLGIVVGIAILAFGNYQIPKKRVTGEVLAVTGMIITLVTIISGRVFYDFFNVELALAMMTVVIILVMTIAIIRKAKPLAIVAVIGTTLIPAFIGDLSANLFLYLSYIFVIDLGVLLVVFLRGWRSLISISLIMTGIYASLLFDSHAVSDQLIWLFMAMFYGLFLISNVVAVLKNQKAVLSDLFVSGINALLVLYWVSSFVPDNWISIVLSGLAIVSALSVYLMLTMLKATKKPIYIYSAVALLFIGVATAFELEGIALTIAFSVEVLVGVVLAAFILRSPGAANIASYLQVIPISLLFIEDVLKMRRWLDIGLFNKYFFALLVAILSLLGTAFVLRKISVKNNKVEFSNTFVTSIIHAVLASLFAILLLWFSLHNLIASESIATGASLVMLTIIGVLLLFYSLSKKANGLKIASGILLGGVVLRLLFVDIWDMPTSGKIVTFLLIGVLLITTAFFSKRLSS